MRQIENARIESTTLGYESHGILSAYLALDYGGAGQSFGGYGLDTYDREQKHRAPHKVCGQFIAAVLRVVGVSRWEDLPGQYVRVDHEHHKVHRLGNIIRDEWFTPEIELAKDA